MYDKSYCTDLAFVFQKLDASEMLDHIHNVRQAIRYAASDLKGKELPGFSIPKKVRYLDLNTAFYSIVRHTK